MTELRDIELEYIPGPDFVKDIRDALGWSQVRLANAVGVKQSTVWRWESGRSTPRGAARKKLRELWAEARGEGPPAKLDIEIGVFWQEPGGDDFFGMLTAPLDLKSKDILTRKSWVVGEAKELHKTPEALYRHLVRRIPEFIKTEYGEDLEYSISKMDGCIV